MFRRNRLSKASLTLASVATLGLALAACSSGSGNSTESSSSSAATGTSSSSSAAQPPLVIGASISLTGDFSDPGKAVEAGYQLWADTVNANGGILGRQVKLDIVDDASDPTQVVTNYQNLINKDHVDLTFGPFSTLLTAPAAQVAARYNYAFLAPAGGGPAVFDEKLGNFFFIQPAPVVNAGDAFANFLLGLPKSEQPKTAAYTELDDPFSAPIAENIRTKLEAAGIQTVYKKVYPAETTNMGPIMQAAVAKKPDIIVGGTQSVDAYGQIKALVQLNYNPKFIFLSNGANSPLNFPKNVGPNNTSGIISSADWFPGSTAPGTAEFVKAYTAMYGGTEQQIDDSSAEAYAVGQLIQEVAQKTGSVDNATIIQALHSGTWQTILGPLSWDQYGAPQGEYNLVQWQNGQLLPIYPASAAQAQPLLTKPKWGSQ